LGTQPEPQHFQTGAPAASLRAAAHTISTARSAAGLQSFCQPHWPRIEAAVGVGLSAQRIYQDLVCNHGFTGSYQAVKRFVRHLREIQPIPLVRMEVEPWPARFHPFLDYFFLPKPSRSAMYSIIPE
jgi:hypothetical protein